MEYGAGYFVERDCGDAKNFFDRKVSFLKERTQELERTIRGKKEQLNQITQVYQSKVQQAASAAGSA